MISTKLLVISLALFGVGFSAPLKREDPAVDTCRGAVDTVDEDVGKTCGVSTDFGGPSPAQLASAECKLASANAVTAILLSCIPASGATTLAGATPKAADFGKSAAAFTAGTKGGDATCEETTSRASNAVDLGCGNGVFSTAVIPNEVGIKNCKDGISQAIAIALNGACGNTTAPTGTSGSAIASSALAQESQAVQDDTDAAVSGAATALASAAATATASSVPPSTATGSPAVAACRDAATTADSDVGEACGGIPDFGGPSAAQLSSAACKSASASAITLVANACSAALGVQTGADPSKLTAADFGKHAAAFKNFATETPPALCAETTDSALAAVVGGCGNGVFSGPTQTNCGDGMAAAVALIVNGACKA